MKAASIGLVVTTANPLYTARELLFQLSDAGATYIFTIPQFMDKVYSLMQPRHFIILISYVTIR